MAMESACKLRVGRERYNGKVRMESGHIDFAGQTKFRFRFTEIRSARQESDSIRFDFHGNPVAISLGQRKTAARWIDEILNPRGLADKLGIKNGQTIRLVNLEDGELMTSLASKNARVVSSGLEDCDLVMLAVERAAELRQLSDLCERVRTDGAIWVVLPKTVRTVTKANVIAAAREAGLAHVKIVDYSETQSAHKIVRGDGLPRSRRGSNNGAPAERPRRARSRRAVASAGKTAAG